MSSNPNMEDKIMKLLGFRLHVEESLLDIGVGNDFLSEIQKRKRQL